MKPLPSDLVFSRPLPAIAFQTPEGSNVPRSKWPEVYPIYTEWMGCRYAVYVFILNDEFEYVGVSGIKGKKHKDGVSGRIWDHVSEPLIRRYIN
jgi:hypothetical protein